MLILTASRVSAVEFSQDSSLTAVGSPESCIRLWSLKGEKLKGKSVGASALLPVHHPF